MGSGSGLTAMPEELVEAVCGHPGMKQTASTQALVGHAHVVTLLDQECDIGTQSSPLDLTIETPLGPVRMTMPYIVLPGGGDVVIIRQKALREKRGIDIMAQLKAPVLKTHGRQDGLQLMPWANSTLGLCGGRRWLSRRLGGAAICQVAWTMASHERCYPDRP